MAKSKVLPGMRMCRLAAALAAGSASGGIWDPDTLYRAPRTFPVTIPCDDFQANTADVGRVFIEGEPWRSKPTRVFAWWGLPKGASADRKVPAMVLVHGGGGTAFAKWVKTWNDRGYAAIAMDTCGAIPQGEGDGKPHPRHAWSGPSGWGSSVAQTGEPLRDQWTYHAVAAVIRCHSFLRTRPGVDPDRIGLTGISWGGYLVSIVGAVDSRFRFAAPVYGCGFYGLNPAWKGESPDADKDRAWSAWSDRWDAKNFLADARIPYLWCCGTNDRWYPLDSVQRSYRLLGSAAPLDLAIRLRMPHGHPPAGDPPEIAALADAVLRGGRPLVDIVSAERDGDVLRVRFDAHGRKAVRAELLSTCSSDPLLMNRKWVAERVPDFDAAGRFSARIPSGAVMYFANVVTDDGLVASTRIFPEDGTPGLVGR